MATDSDVDEDEDTSQVQSELVGHHFATIHVQEGCRLQYHRRCILAVAPTKLNPLIIHWFKKEMVNVKSQFYGSERIKIFCEYKREGIRYRAHPNFRQLGPWHDWVMVTYDAGDDTSITSDDVNNALLFHPDKNPSKIMCFFVPDNEEDAYALVQSCQTSNHYHDSILFQCWTKEFIG